MPSHGAHPTTPALAQLQAACAYLEQERSLNERLGQQNTALMSVNESQKAHMEELQRSVAQLTVSPRTLARADDGKLLCVVKELTSWVYSQLTLADWLSYRWCKLCPTPVASLRLPPLPLSLPSPLLPSPPSHRRLSSTGMLYWKRTDSWRLPMSSTW